jgi:hypothetical protein
VAEADVDDVGETLSVDRRRLAGHDPVYTCRPLGEWGADKLTDVERAVWPLYHRGGYGLHGNLRSGRASRGMEMRRPRDSERPPVLEMVPFDETRSRVLPVASATASPPGVAATELGLLSVMGPASELFAASYSAISATWIQL